MNHLNYQPGYLDPRIRIIRLKENKGPGVTREIGRVESSGDHINYLDSDDYLHPEKIKQQVQVLLRNHAADMRHCNSDIFLLIQLLMKVIPVQISDHSFSTILPIILFQRTLAKQLPFVDKKSNKFDWALVLPLGW